MSAVSLLKRGGCVFLELRPPLLFLIGGGVLLLSACAASQYSVQPHEYSGVRLYQTFCASCHGLTARGDGPLAPLLKTGAPDLTRISERNGGTFPRDEVQKIIDGRSEHAGHGSRTMPVWAFEFYPDHMSDRLARREAEATIERPVNYLETIQQGDHDNWRPAR